MIIYPEAASITTTSFTMTHWLQTGLWMLSYRCLGLDRNFPYHLNLFTNQVAFSSTSVSVKTNFDILTDYNALASSYGYTFTTFTPINGSDYSMNKIVVFISCFGFYGSAAPAIVDVTTTILNATHFYYHFVFGTGVSIDRYHLNLIVFDQGSM